MNFILRGLFILLIYTPLFGQQNISGIVIDLKSKKPISAANVYIKNGKIGTISNSEGSFVLYYPKKEPHEKFVVSCIGYESFEIEIEKFNTGDSIYLANDIFKLDEVVVKAQRKLLSGKEIVDRALNNVDSTFYNQPYISKGFFRHLEKTKSSYKWFVEAAVEVYDPGFKKSPKDIKTNVVEVRKSIDNRVVDTLTIYKWYLEQVKDQSIRKAWVKTTSLQNIPHQELQNAISHYDNYFSLSGWKKPFFYSLFSTDINKIRFLNQKKASLYKKNIHKKHLFKVDTTLTFEGNIVYKIKISPQAKPYKDFGKKFIPVGWIYIRKKDYAILEFEYTLINIGSFADLTQKISGTNIHSYLKLKFRELNGKMYVKHMIYKSPKLNRFKSIIDAMNNPQSAGKDPLYYFSKQELLITEVITQREEVLEKETEMWSNNLFSKRPFNKDFWKTYSTLPETKEELQLIKDLENEVNFKESFNNKN